MEKNLEYFKQQVFKDVEYDQLYQHQINKMNNEASELYAEHKAQEASDKVKKEYQSEWYGDGYHNGWNEALHWAAENAEAYIGRDKNGVEYTFVSQNSILKGLK